MTVRGTLLLLHSSRRKTDRPLFRAEGLLYRPTPSMTSKSSPCNSSSTIRSLPQTAFVPYEVSYTVPATATSLTIRTIATDLGGASSSSVPITVAVSANSAPVVSLLKPQSGSVLIEGQTIELLAQASDDGEVKKIVFTVGGVELPADLSAPFWTTYTVPMGVSSLTISATATDDKGLSSTVTETFAVTPATPTTVTGRVVTLANQPLAGATVSVFGEFFAQTAPDGTFSIAGVPTLRGRISVTASAIIDGQQSRKKLRCRMENYSLSKTQGTRR